MTFIEYLAQRWQHLFELALEHAVVVLIAVVLAAVLGVGLGLLTYRRPWAREALLRVASVLLTVPSFALFGLLIVILGLGWTPTVLALVAYGLLPILRNTVTGLRGVNPAVVESARGVGLSPRQELLDVELPLAWPVILAGVRVSTQLIVGIAAIAAAVGGPGLGNDIFAGLARMGGVTALPLALAATVGVIVIALVLDAFYVLIGKLTTPRGIRD